jgi:hypothetical protein
MTTSRPPRWGYLAAPALFTALAAAGCGSDGAEDGAGASGAASSEAPSQAPTAADGTDYSACDDGACEVAITQPPVEFAFADFTLTITAVTDNGIEYEKVGTDSGTGTGSMGGVCFSTMSAESTSTQCHGGIEGEAPQPDPEPSTVELQLLAVADGTAIIRIAEG